MSSKAERTLTCIIKKASALLWEKTAALRFLLFLLLPSWLLGKLFFAQYPHRFAVFGFLFWIGICLLLLLGKAVVQGLIREYRECSH